MKYKLLKDLPGCKAGAISWLNDNKVSFGGLVFTLDVIDGSPEFFGKMKELWYINIYWNVIRTPDLVLKGMCFESEEEALKYKRWHEPRFSLQDVEDAVLKNSANVTDEIERLER